MNRRRLLLDASPGERRGVVLLDDRPERLLIERHGQSARLRVGDLVAGRVRRIDRSTGVTFVDLGEPPDGVLRRTSGGPDLAEGGLVRLLVCGPARAGKGPLVRALGGHKGRLGLLEPAPDLLQRLCGFAPGQPIEGGAPARRAADEAQEEALDVQHRLASGARLFIEPTEALTAIDVDVAAAAVAGPVADRRRTLARVNGEALRAAARLLRLKGLGGLVVIDLAGKGHDGAALAAAAKDAFAADGPGVSIGPISRFGLLEMALPWTSAPLREVMLDADGGASAETVGLALLRQIQAEAQPGVQVLARCAPKVAEVVERFRPDLIALIGPRFQVHADPSIARSQVEVTQT